MRVGLGTGVPVLSVSLTPHQYQEMDHHNAIFRNHFLEKDVRLLLPLLVSREPAKLYFAKPPDIVRAWSFGHSQFIVQIYAILLRIAAAGLLVGMSALVYRALNEATIGQAVFWRSIWSLLVILIYA